MATPALLHELALKQTRAEKARVAFASALRVHVLERMAGGLKIVYERELEPGLRRALRRPARSGEEVRLALLRCEYFRFYSALRVAAQDFVYQSVAPALERERERLIAAAHDLAERRPLGSLQLHPGFQVPRSVSAIDIHLMPGGYTAEDGDHDLTAGATYDNRLAASSMGLMGRNLDDIGQSISRFVHMKYLQFRPLRILDLGCTIGHNTGAWKDTFPEAEVHGIDVAAPCLRYGLARARSQGRAIHFEQMNAEALQFADDSFDAVVSSMFLHEVPPRGVARVLREAHRVLKRGGLMLHMELPPNAALPPFEAFYLDWDAHYNNEPFYKAFRDLDLARIVRHAGFAPKNLLQFVVPSIGQLGAERWRHAIARSQRVDGHTGRLASGVSWFCFGAWK